LLISSQQKELLPRLEKSTRPKIAIDALQQLLDDAAREKAIPAADVEKVFTHFRELVLNEVDNKEVGKT
jgi:hypothetical protein